MTKYNDDDFIFGRLQNEMKEIEEQKRRNAERVKQSEKNWLAKVLLEIGQVLGKAITGTFEFLSDLINSLFK